MQYIRFRPLNRRARRRNGSRSASAGRAARRAPLRFYKVGLEMFAAAGMDFVRELKAQGHRVFVDLKLYDIGETVKRAVAQVAKVGADFLTVHGSRAVMAAAVAGRGESSLKLLAVTVLTSFDENDLRQMGYSCDVASLVELRVRNAMDAGIDGVVCSPLEVARVRADRRAARDAGDSRRAFRGRIGRRSEARGDARRGDRQRSGLPGDRPPGHPVQRSARGVPQDLARRSAASWQIKHQQEHVQVAVGRRLRTSRLRRRHRPKRCR